jgi:hypothetical protein
VAVIIPVENVKENVTFWIGRVKLANTSQTYTIVYYDSKSDEHSFHPWINRNGSNEEILPLQTVLDWGDKLLTKENKVKQVVLDNIEKSRQQLALLDVIGL